MKARKILSQLLAAVLLFTLTVGFSGCGNNPAGTETPSVASSPDPAAASDGPASSNGPTTATTVSTKKTPADTFVYGIGFASSKFDPTDSVDAWPTVNRMVYENLVVYNAAAGEIEPRLAQSWQWIDNKTLVLQLRDYVTFSDGTKFTGDDVLFSWNRMLKSMMWAAQAKNIDFPNCKVDGSTLTIKLVQPNSEFLANICAIGYAVVSKSYVEKNGEDYFKLNPMGTGPYKQVGFTEGQSVTFQLNDNYWGEKPAYQNVIIKMMLDESTLVSSFEAGELDAIKISTNDNIAALTSMKAEGVNVDSVTGGMAYSLNLGDINQYFRDKNLRLAYAHAIDWNALVQAIWGDNAALMSSCIPNFSVYYKAVGMYEYNPELAKKYLADGGCPDGYTINMAVGNTGNDQAIAEIMQAYLQAVGIRLVLTVTDNLMARQLSSSGEMDISYSLFNGFNGYASNAIIGKITGSNSLLQEIHTDTESGKIFQQYIVDLMTELDTAKRKAIAEEMQQYIYDECLWIPICQMNFNVASWDYVKGAPEMLSAYGTDAGLDIRGLLLQQ